MTPLHHRIAAFAAVVLLALGFAAPAAQAQELSPEHLDLARKYVDLTYKTPIFEQSLVQAGLDVSRLIIQQNPDAETASNEVIGDTIGSFRDRKKQVFDQFARVYAVRFTMDELREMNTFYETETGQKLASQLTSINEDVFNIYQVFEDNLRTEFLAKVRADLKEKGIEL